jgi:uncharacterized membrane protein (DUF106 family)
MSYFNSAIDAVLRAFYTAFSWAPPAVGLTVLSAAVGVGMLWVFRKTSNQERMKAVKRRVYASLLELRVYADEPAVTWRAQKSLFSANLRYMGLALRPALWMAVPIALLLIHLEAFYGRAPLPVAHDAVVTMGMAESWNPETPAPALTVPAGVEIAGPPVRVIDSREVTWRIRPRSELSGLLSFNVDGQAVTKSIEAGARPRYIPGKSVSSTIAALWNPGESIASPAVDWLEVRYPEASLRVFGFSMNWLVWFFVVSMVAALLLKGRFGVVL